jgi:hypothetical protein
MLPNSLSNIYSGILFGIYSGILSDIYSDILYLAFSLAFSSVAEVDKKGTREKSWEGEKFRALVQTLIYKSHCKTHRIVFSEALPLRSARDHSDPGRAVRVRQECCDLALAVEGRRRRRRSRRRRRRPADIKSNNPDVTGGEQ